MPVAQAAYKYYSERTARVIAVLFLLGGLIIWSSTWMTGAWSSALLSLGVSAISLAAFSTVSEYFLKIALTDDILSRIQMRAEVAASGFSWVRAERDIPWAEVLSSAREVDCIVKSPEAFRQSVWPHLLAAARVRSIHLQVFICAGSNGRDADPLPGRHLEADGEERRTAPGEKAPTVPGATYGESESSTMGLDTTSPAYRYAKALEESWKSAKASRDVNSRCELRVAIVQQAADCAIVRTSNRQLILLSPPRGSHEDGTAMLFERDGDSLTGGWVNSLIRRYAETSDDVWTDMRKKGVL